MSDKETKQKSLFEDDNMVVVEKEREIETSKPELKYSIGITQKTQSIPAGLSSHRVTVIITIPVENTLDIDVLKDDIKVASGHICMLVNIRDREKNNV